MRLYMRCICWNSGAFAFLLMGLLCANLALYFFLARELATLSQIATPVILLVASTGFLGLGFVMGWRTRVMYIRTYPHVRRYGYTVVRRIVHFEGGCPFYGFLLAEKDCRIEKKLAQPQNPESGPVLK